MLLRRLLRWRLLLLRLPLLLLVGVVAAEWGRGCDLREHVKGGADVRQVGLGI